MKNLLFVFSAVAILASCATAPTTEETTTQDSTQTTTVVDTTKVATDTTVAK